MILFLVDDPDLLGGEFGRHPLYKMLGYFSLIGLLRLHSLLGDYFQAIKVLEYIELDKQVEYAQRGYGARIESRRSEEVDRS